MPSFRWRKTASKENEKAEFQSMSIYRSIAKNIFEVQSALNSTSQVAKKSNISFVIVRILFELINAKHNSIARLHSHRIHFQLAKIVFFGFTVLLKHQHL